MKKVLLIVAIVMVAVILTTLFVACSQESYEKQLEKKGYNVVAVSSDNKIALATTATVLGAEGNIEFIVTGTKDGESVNYIKFEKTSDAKNFVKSVKDADSSNVKVSRNGSTVKYVVTK